MEMRPHTFLHLHTYVEKHSKFIFRFSKPNSKPLVPYYKYYYWYMGVKLVPYSLFFIHY